MIMIRKAVETDSDAIWQIFREVVEEGTTFCPDEQTTKEQALRMWMTPNTYVACLDEVIVGAYILMPNQPGRGAHVANASYIVKSEFRHRGIGRALGEHSLMTARKMGFTAMQFNCVVSTNEAAVKLWLKLGFSIVGTLPKAFRHPQFGFVDAYVMYRPL